jgi:lysozyme family protein
MAIERYAEALARVLVHEGGYVDHPADPGGKTNKGVTQRVYDAYRARRSLAKRSVKAITDDELQQIYRQQYWDVIKGNDLPAGVDYAVFDGAVNSGPRQAVKWLQRALGFTGKAVDGVVGNVTLNAIAQESDHDALIARITDRRETFLRALKTWPVFGRGWLKRIRNVEEAGQAWAMGSVGPEPEYTPSGGQKGRIEDAKKAPPKTPGDLAAGGGMAGTGGGATLDQVLNGAKEQLEPFQAFGFVKGLVVAIIIAGVVVTVGGFAYRWWAARKAAELADALDSEATAK